ncbi:hypothetical protein [Ornithobacterium rhinotracheale]|nr:hypothetical protein [Ornithobacterium rhinotracheale]
MKKQEKVLKLTEEEKELIEAIRNYQQSKHNPSFDLEWKARDLFEKLME